MIKDVVVNLPINAAQDAVTPYATSLAGAFGSQLTGIAFQYQPIIAPDIMGLTDARFAEKQEAEAARKAEAALQRLRNEIQREQIPWTARAVDVSAEEAPGKFAEIARAFDLAIVGQEEPDRAGVENLIAEATLFESGRPTLVIPYVQRKAFCADRVAVCWDGSRPASRAINDMLPLLHRDSDIKLVTIQGERALREELPGADMAEHLARHGYKIELHNLTIGEDIASTILNFVADRDIDLLVMGAYGHTRLREFILGGATRGILESMTVPTLMSH